MSLATVTTLKQGNAIPAVSGKPAAPKSCGKSKCCEACKAKKEAAGLLTDAEKVAP